MTEVPGAGRGGECRAERAFIRRLRIVASMRAGRACAAGCACGPETCLRAGDVLAGRVGSRDGAGLAGRVGSRGGDGFAGRVGSRGGDGFAGRMGLRGAMGLRGGDGRRGGMGSRRRDGCASAADGRLGCAVTGGLGCAVVGGPAAVGGCSRGRAARAAGLLARDGEVLGGRSAAIGWGRLAHEDLAPGWP
ncbi:hypothetical protein GCM10022380_79970 [Amycolatopsis tucumanensis]|uniref:Uncharacterized protein n=1 Tax=Amycolatopsis tucumanensis TaxID=401106 RepID=A0ABP7JNW3_9PSEU